MRRIKLTRYEQAIEDAVEESVPVSKEEQESIVRAITAYRKDAVLNLRINSQDLQNLKRKAKKLGVKYQTFISEILHRVAQS